MDTAWSQINIFMSHWFQLIQLYTLKSNILQRSLNPDSKFCPAMSEGTHGAGSLIQTFLAMMKSWGGDKKISDLSLFSAHFQLIWTFQVAFLRNLCVCGVSNLHSSSIILYLTVPLWSLMMTFLFKHVFWPLLPLYKTRDSDYSCSWKTI